MGKTIDNLCDSCTNTRCEFQSGIVRTECAFYMPPHIDSVKQKLLDSLAEEPTMVLSTAYAYAKNYVNYGEDITKAWATAVQQASILEQVRQKAWTEAYDSFKSDYESRLKADMAAMLEELGLEIEELKSYESVDGQDLVMLADIGILFQQKINALRGKENDGKNNT